MKKRKSATMSKRSKKRNTTSLKVVVATISELGRINEDGEFTSIELSDYIAGHQDCVPKRIVEARTVDNFPVKFGTVVDIPARESSNWEGERQEKGVKPFYLRHEFFIGRFIPNIGRLQFNPNFPWVREVFAPPYPIKCRRDFKLLYGLCNETAQGLSTAMEYFGIVEAIPQPPLEECDESYSEDPLDFVLDKVLKKMIQSEAIKLIVKDIMKNKRDSVEHAG